MQMGFYFDQTRCTGCFTCIVACKDWNNVPAGPASWRRVVITEKGHYPDVFAACMIAGCWHCIQPACAQACPADAITKREEDGLVLVDQKSCIGRDNCGICLDACPYNVPQFGSEKNPRMQKCNFCADRLAAGMKPACVDACPMRALDAGPLEKIIEQYGGIREAEGFNFHPAVMPAIIFKPLKDNACRTQSKVVAAPGCFNEAG